ncbi:MAG: 2,3-bisphosphoglycerate-independent phosphoglycerate mutase [Rickettsiales bacterium]|jgi:2,3-bisphosphoglycerate-independent phosphoglycerate mutase
MDNVKKPVLLCILVGWGIGDENAADNAIARAKTPNFDQILQEFPHSKLGTSGADVGLPDGQMGNSEVGHVCIGSGRIIFQDLPRINNAIKDGSLAQNQYLQDLIKSSKTCHLMGMISDGGVHGHIDHVIFLAKTLATNGVNVKLHCFLDGRDVAQKSAITHLQSLKEQISDFPQIEISTLSGRHYAMDRDSKWDRIEPAFKAIVEADSPKFIDPITAVEHSYQDDVNDEFLIPVANENYAGMKDGDSLLVASFRADRIRQISTSLLDENFNKFLAKKIKFSSQVSMTSYSDKLSQYFAVLFPSIEIKNSLGEVLEQQNMTQARIAETEKYAHVTFFFSGGKESEFVGEKRIMIQSPSVKTYDLMPEMSAAKVGEELQNAIKSGQYDFIVVNYANPDMVGHSGAFDAAVIACQIIDQQVGNLRDLILGQNGKMLICADHGNIEDMVDDFGNPHTSHTTNPVPFILVSSYAKDLKLEDGRLCDIAPTILNLMNIDQPSQMTGKNLIIK